MSGPRSRLVHKLGLSILTLVVIFGGGELICRLAGVKPDEFKWQSSSDVQILPAPDQDSFMKRLDGKSIPIHINHYGQRGADYPLQKPAGELRLIVLGDSLTMGKGVGDDETFAAQLQRLLAEQRGPTRPVRVINAGVNGWSTWHYAAWAQTLLPRFSADVLVVGLFLGNDHLIAPASYFGIPVPLENALRNSSLYTFLMRKYRNHLWKRVQAAKLDLSIEELDDELRRYQGLNEDALPLEAEMALWERKSLPHLLIVRDACRAANVRLVVLLLPTWGIVSGKIPDTVHTLLRERLAAMDIATVECLGDLVPAGREAWHEWDSGHPSEAGHQVVAQSLLTGLRTLGIVD
jgi:lysophospholipase L1-like esterase